MAQKAQPRGRLADALWMWFGALGGAVAWAVHLGSAWGLTETTCLSGHSQIGGTPLPFIVAIATTIPLVVAVLSLAAAWVMWRRTGPRYLDDSTPSGGRAHLVAGVGMAANLLFVAIIAFDGVALMVFAPCQT